MEGFTCIFERAYTQKVKSALKYVIVSYTSLQFKISFALFWFLIYLVSLKTS